MSELVTRVIPIVTVHSYKTELGHIFEIHEERGIYTVFFGKKKFKYDSLNAAIRKLRDCIIMRRFDLHKFVEYLDGVIDE